MKKTWKWIIGVVGGIILLLLLAGWYYGRNWKPIVKEKLDQRIAAATHGLYTLQYDDIDLSLISGNVTLKNVAFRPDSTVYRELVEAEKAPDSRFDVALASLKIKGLGIWSALVAKKLTIRHIAFDTVHVQMTTETQAYNKKIDTSRSESLYDRVKDVFRAIHVEQSTIDNLHVAFSKIENGQSDTIKIDSIRVHMHDLLLDESSFHDSTRVFYTKEIGLEIPGFTYAIPNSVYQVAFDRLVVNTKKQNALLTKVALHPRVSKQAYFVQDKQNKAMIVLKWDTLRLEKLDFNALIDRQLIFARYAYLHNGTASFHKDKRYQQDNVHKIGQAPHQQVMKLNQRIRFDTVFVANTDVSYHEYSAKYNRIGYITFEKARGNITNLTNDRTHLAKDPYMRADLQARLMGSGVLHAQFGFDMLSPAGHHTYKGTLGEMQATAFNRILTPLLNFEFSSGIIRRIRFDMQGTDHKNWGTFRFTYDHMKISLLHAPEGASEQKKKGALSFLVNELLVNDSNPDASGVYRVGKVEHTRVPEYSHFKTIWKSLQEGIQQSVGVSKGADQEEVPIAEDQPQDKDSRSFIEKTGDFFKGLFKKKEE